MIAEPTTDKETTTDKEVTTDNESKRVTTACLKRPISRSDDADNDNERGPVTLSATSGPRGLCVTLLLFYREYFIACWWVVCGVGGGGFRANLTVLGIVFG